ncbi:hypothetical protein LJR235_002292 [Pararhizobium sp. LjRoot235]|uniref:hypothetical protein n=1 Tax=Pararhizobium sp. LjRoot235 TaxID=3342291 RepID=UPI003ECD27F1
MRPEHHIKQHILEKRVGIVPNHKIPEVVTYLRPTKTETFDTMPGPSSASRIPSDKSPFNTRATAVNPLNDTIILMESALELKAGRILKTMDVVELREQWPKVTYVDFDGVTRAHTFDFWIRKRCGKRVVIAVKPFEKLASKLLIDLLILIKDQGIGGFADDVSFITEYFASEYAAANAEEILFARRARNDADVEEAKQLLMDVRGHIRFGELLKGLEVQAYRRTALWVLIGEGWLRPVIPSRIEDHTLMEVRLPVERHAP